MELNREQIERELDAIATGAGLCPLENPAVKPITEEMLLLPHPSEPGVGADGTACPRENPPLDDLCTS
jgi:hypothetical protein